MDSVDPLRILLSFAFVLGLMGIGAAVLKRYASKKGLMPSAQSNRIHVLETRFLDAKRKLILVRCGNSEHLLLISPGSELLIETTAASPMMPSEQRGE